MAAPYPQPYRTARWIISWIFMIIASVSIGIGYIKLDNTTDTIAMQGRVGRYELCKAFNELRSGEVRLIRFSTRPVDETGLTPERLEVARETNRVRAEFRREALARIAPKRNCAKVRDAQEGGSG